MKRIIAALTKKIEAIKVERKERRVLRAIEIAKDNAQDKIEEADAKMAQIVEGLPEREDTTSFINDLAALLDEIELQKVTIERLDHLKSYLEEEIEVEVK